MKPHALAIEGNGRAVLVATVALGLLWPAKAAACTPIVPLVILFGGPYLVLASISWLLLAVLFKCFAYAFLEKGRPRLQSAWRMFVANLVSTIAGLLVADFST